MATAVRKDNPYVTGYQIMFGEDDGIQARRRVGRIESEGDKIHTVTEYDTLWDLAFDNYGNSKYWWLIYDTNDLDDPFTLPVGVNVVIPDLKLIQSLL